MKKQFLNSILYYSFIGLLFSVLFIACNKDDSDPVSVPDDIEETENTAVSAEEAANAVATSLSAESNYGMCAVVVEAEEIIETSEATTIIDTSFTVNYSVPPYSYYAEVALEMTYIDNGSNNDQYIVNYSGNSDFSSIRLNGTHNATGDFTATIPGENETEYKLNGLYNWSGVVNSNIYSGLSYTANVTLDVNSLTIDYENEDIESGSASVVISGTTADGDTFKYTGKITFYENKAAQLELDGKYYSIDIYRGIVE
ncbi:MAG: hypothetical protein V1720_13935 [bacterium]